MDNDSIGSLTSEQWELCIENIPGDIQLEYAPFVAGLSFIIRVHLYQILDSLNYSKEYCLIILDVMKYVGSANCDRFIQYGIALDVTRRPLFFYICRSLTNPQLTEFLSHTSVDIVKKIMEIAFYITESDVNTMIHLIHDLSVQEFYTLVTLSNEPFAKHCRLCRSKRSYQLEYRLLHEQITDAHCTLPGILPLYEKAEIWQADNDSKFYSFNYERNIILWRKDIVDLIKICDKCLMEVHAASSEVGRFEAYHHEEGIDKKHHLEEMRYLEQKRAHLINQIAIERVRRRVKEWSIHALKCQREGYLREEKQRQQIKEQQHQEELKRIAIQSQNQLIHTALSTDKYWLQQERNTQAVRNQYKSDLVELKTYPKYTRENPMKPIREHVHSWRLTPYGGVDDKMPIDKDAVSKRFGTGDIAPDIRITELTMWKNQTQYLHKNYLNKLKLQEEEEKEKRRLEAIELNQYLQERFYQTGRASRLRQNEMEQAEEDRLNKRRLEKEKRRLERERREEGRQRVLMCSEDRYSFRMRYYDDEERRQEREREGMYEQERLQTKIDQFWGIPTAIRNAKNAQATELLEWHETVDEYRKMCIQVRIIRPYPSEYGQYRDKYTGKKIK